MEIKIEMTDRDFGMLHVESNPHDPDLPYAEHFEPYEDHTAPVSQHFKYVYWLEPGWTTVMMAKAFLTAQGEEFELVYDHSASDYCWALLTNYRDASVADDATVPSSTTIWRIDYQSTAFERYDTDMNSRMEEALKRIGSITEVDGGSDGTTADNGFTVETLVYDATAMGTVIRSVLGERPYTLRIVPRH